MLICLSDESRCCCWTTLLHFMPLSFALPTITAQRRRVSNSWAQFCFIYSRFFLSARTKAFESSRRVSTLFLFLCAPLSTTKFFSRSSSIQKMINKRDSCLAVIFIILQLKFFPFEFDDEKRVNLSIWYLKCYGDVRNAVRLFGDFTTRDTQTQTQAHLVVWHISLMLYGIFPLSLSLCIMR